MADYIVNKERLAYYHIKNLAHIDDVAATTEANAKSYADGVDTKAQGYANNAETNAKSHATTVASTAESNAKGYADEVAETAETNAKGYADGVAATAETNAKTYADGVGTSATSAAVAQAKAYHDEEEIFETDILTVSALGGIAAGADLNGMTTHEILNKLLYPYVAQVVDTPSRTPNITAALEKGNNQTITAVSVKVTKKSEAITSVALYNGNELIAEKTGDEVAAGGTFTFSGLSVSVPSTSVVLTVKVTDASGNVVSKNTAGWTFVYPYYTGTCEVGAEINEALVESLTKKVEAKANKTYSFTTNNTCMVIAYPKAHGVLKQILDPNGFDCFAGFTRSEVNVTGLDGTAQAYYVYVDGASTNTNYSMTFKY